MEKSTYENKFRRNGIEMPIHCIHIIAEKREQKKYYPHYHEYIEILYSLNSDSTVYINGKLVDFKTGDLMIINSGENHDLWHKIDNTNYIVIKVLPEVLYSNDLSVFEMKYLMPFIIENSKNKRFFSKEEIGNNYIHHLVSEIMEEWIEGNYGYEIAIRSNVLKLFLWVLRYWKNNHLSSLDMFDYSDEILRIVSKALEYVSKNYVEITERDVADYCNLSYSYFSRIFKKVMKQSFSEYLNSYRITKAEQLLSSTDKSISEISEILGFSTPSYFIHQFKTKREMSPKQYRMNFARKNEKTML